MKSSYTDFMRFRFLRFILLFILLAGVAGIVVEYRPSLSSLRPSPTTSSTRTGSGSASATWVKVDEGAERAQFTFAEATSSDIILYRFEPAYYRLRFAHHLPPLTVAAWASELPEARLLVNGVYFHEDNFPSGILITSGTRIGARQFDKDKSGVILLDGKPALLKSGLDPKAMNVWHEAAQSFPFLIWNGAAAVTTDTQKLARRTMIGTDKEGRVYLGVLPFSSLSLYGLSHALMTLPIRWQSVLNLDGGPSTGLMSRLGGYSEMINSYGAVPNVLVVERR